MDAGEAVDSSWPTRQDVADQLGVCERTVRRLEQRRRLSSERDSNGVHRVNPRSLAAHLATRGRPEAAGVSIHDARPGLSSEHVGPLMSSAFEAFSRGLSRRDVVIRLQLDPAVTAAAHDYWTAFGSDLVVSEKDRQELEALGIPLTSSEDLMRTIKSLIRLLDAFNNLAPECACGCGRVVPLTGRAAAHVRRTVKALRLTRADCIVQRVTRD